MKAIIVAAPNDIRMIDTAKPKVGKKDVLAKVIYSGICGTDLAILSGNLGFVKDGSIKYPVRIGHEWSGVVAEVGEAVANFKPGDRIVSDNGVTCGVCEYCLNGQYQLCNDTRSVGTINCWDGSFAEYILMPERHVYKLPDNVSLEEGALIEPASIALGGIKQSNITSASKVLVIGTGPIGLAAVALVKNRSGAKVLLSGRKSSKLEVGKMMGADATVNVTKENLTDFVMANTGGTGVNIILETSGNIDTLNQCLDIIEPKGVIALIGFYETELNHFNIDKLVSNCLHLKGIMGEFGLVKEVLDLMAARSLNLMPLITHRFRFGEAVAAMQTAQGKNDTKIKMLVNVAEM